MSRDGVEREENLRRLRERLEEEFPSRLGTWLRLAGELGLSHTWVATEGKALGWRLASRGGYVAVPVSTPPTGG